jgi:hypothetical protein
MAHHLPLLELAVPFVHSFLVNFAGSGPPYKRHGMWHGRSSNQHSADYESVYAFDLAQLAAM